LWQLERKSCCEANKESLICRIDLSKKVFRPRIETEFWVGKAIKKIKKLYQNRSCLEILDIFAGTGCIGLAVLKNIEKSRVDFVDIDPGAIDQIKINLKLNRISKTKYKIYQSSMFEKLKKRIKNRRLALHRNGVSGAGYDVIFANPPYVATTRIAEVQKKVLETEPKSALFAGKDGMKYIKKFIKEVKNYLKPDGIFFLEFDPLQKEKIKKLLEKENFKFKFYKDQFGKYRWLMAGLNQPV